MYSITSDGVIIGVASVSDCHEVSVFRLFIFFCPSRPLGNQCHNFISYEFFVKGLALQNDFMKILFAHGKDINFIGFLIYLILNSHGQLIKPVSLDGA